MEMLGMSQLSANIYSCSARMRSQIVSVYKVETLNASAYSGEIKSIFPWKLFVGQKQVMNQVVIDSYTFAVSKTILLCFILPFRVCKKLFPVQATLNEAECPEGLFLPLDSNSLRLFILKERVSAVFQSAKV